MLKNIFDALKIVVMPFLGITLLKGNTTNFFILLFTLILLIVADFIYKKFGYSLCIQILIYIFIIGTEIFGEIFAFYAKIVYFDIIMHTLSGFIVTAIGISLINKFNCKGNKIFWSFFIFLFSMGIAAVWEITEFTIDRVLGKDMQKDTVIKEIASELLMDNRERLKVNEIKSVVVNGRDFVKEYDGYIDIGLYDTMEDMIFAMLGTIFYMIIEKVKLFKKLHCI